MGDITSAIALSNPRRIHIRRALIRCVSGPERGASWTMERDVIQIGSSKTADIVLTDPTVSRRHAEIRRGRDGVVLKDLGSMNGTFVGQVQAREVFLGADTLFRVGRTELSFTTADEVIDVEPSEAQSFERLIGRSMPMREVFGILERVAPTDLTVLISGETGTGKELASRAVHTRSSRRERPFVVFDCGAAPEALIESELFGHNRGAFTGAIEARPGVFEQANGGTIFLDEIGELPLELQPKLLRVLEQREVRRVGANKTMAIDVRVVAATNRDLRTEVEEGRFREDLYYRLAVVEMTMPPLRERAEDVPVLAQHLLKRSPHNANVSAISADVLDLFERYRWPGNVRELSNVIERALPFCDGSVIDLPALPEAMKAASSRHTPPGADASRPPESTPPAAMSFKDAKDKLITAFERQYLIDLLDRFDGNVSKAARSADMDRKTITRLMRKHGIDRES